MQLDKTAIAITQRNLDEILDLSLSVLRRYGAKLLIVAFLGALPFAIINALLLSSRTISGGYVLDTYDRAVFLFWMAALVYVESPLAMAPVTMVLGNMMFGIASILTETFKNALNLNKVKDISISDVQKFASLVFEMKKPLKAELINHLNERYGVNVQNLKDPVTFKSLLNTQVVIFETLAKISPKKSVQREVLLSLSESLNEKNGVEAIDCNEVIQEVFMAAGYDDILINESLNNYLDFEKIASDLDKVGGVLRMIKGASAGAPQPTPSMGMEVPPPQSVEDDDVKGPAMNPEDDEEGAMAMTGAESMSSEEENDEIEAGEAEPSQEEVMGKMKELEDLISSLKMEIGGGEESDDEMEDFEESPEDESAEGEEEEIDMEQADLDDQEDEIEAEHEEAHETEDEAEEKEDIVRKKKKSLEKKEDNLKKMK